MGKNPVAARQNVALLPHQIAPRHLSVGATTEARGDFLLAASLSSEFGFTIAYAGIVGAFDCESASATPRKHPAPNTKMSTNELIRTE
ncbi:hypothetical protein ACO0LO_11925 [Undibacterium sp. TJN25]|uniref:hypothetical protein n=1 Tax=Undibacterium sp. TJN25 TaxID=3413056 RepID=UPI003BF35575